MPPTKFRLSAEAIRRIEECLEHGFIAEVKIEKSRPVVVELRRQLVHKEKTSGKDREEIQRDHRR